MGQNGFKELLPSGIDAEAIYHRTFEKLEEEEAVEVLAETAITVTAERDRDDFHSWNYGQDERRQKGVSTSRSS
jgi:hypothetical protein